MLTLVNARLWSGGTHATKGTRVTSLYITYGLCSQHSSTTLALCHETGLLKGHALSGLLKTISDMNQIRLMLEVSFSSPYAWRTIIICVSSCKNAARRGGCRCWLSHGFRLYPTGREGRSPGREGWADRAKVRPLECRRGTCGRVIATWHKTIGPTLGPTAPPLTTRGVAGQGRTLWRG